MDNLPSKIIIIGAGPSGLFAARRLKELAKRQNKTIDCIIFEKEDYAGGKCHTYSDEMFPELKTEYGAALFAPNYGVVLDALNYYNLPYEEALSAASETVEMKQVYDRASFFEKLDIAKTLAHELSLFNEDYEIYKQAKQQRKSLPGYFSIPFSFYAAFKHIRYLPILAEPFVPGFGYGALTQCPAYAVMEYFGKMTLPDIILAEKLIGQPPLLSIKGGYQLLMEKIASEFDLRLNTRITRIQRENDQVSVFFQQNDIEHVETAETLILATSPKNWTALGLDFRPIELECVNQLEFYRYPVAICKIKGLPPQQYYFPKALKEEGFNHIALITTRDNRTNPPDGRLCTIYINLPEGRNEFQWDKAAIVDELKAILEVTDVTILEEKIWEDYMSTLPWDLRLDLDASQKENNTLYLGSYALGAFEDVVSVANKATDEINRQYSTPTFEEDFSGKNIERFWRFFTQKLYPPVDSRKSENTAVNRCIIV